MSAKTSLLAALCVALTLPLRAQPGTNPVTPPVLNAPPPSAVPTPSATRVVTGSTAAPGLPVPGAPAVSQPASAATPAAPAAPPGLPVPTPAGPNPAALPALPGPAAAVQIITNAPPAQPPDDTIPAGTIDWVGAGGADLEQVFEYYAKLTGRTILRPANLAAPPIKLRTETDLTRREFIQALDSVLAMNGISMIPVGDKFVKAVPSAQANQEGAPLQRLDAEALPELGSYVTHIVQLKYAKPSELVQVLTPFAKVPNGILPIDSNQILVLRDNAENVKRMLELIREIDVSVPSEYISEVIPIKYAMASDIAAALNSLSAGGGTTSVGARGATTRTPATGLQRPGTMGLPGQPGTLQPGTTPGQPNPQASFSERLQQIVRRASAVASGEIQILGQTKIIADERANALLVYATKEDMAMIKDIISKLDVILPQVLIETTILDVSLNNKWNLGISGLQTTRQLGGNNILGAGGLNANQVFNFSGTGTNLTADLLGTGLRYFTRIDDSFYVTLQAAASDGTARVIQKPRILTSHAKPATFFVGETVPYITSTYYGGFGTGPAASYQQLRVGIQLSVTPFINADGLVLMQIDQAIDELGDEVEIAGGGKVPKTRSRTLSAEVAVRNGESVLLGGYIRSAGSESHAGVPLLKDIPLLGYLFRSNDRSRDRSELMVLMRPIVLMDPEEAAKLSTEERLRLPGVRRAEREFNHEEQLWREKQERKTRAPGNNAAQEPAATR
ncbi:MAG: secretin N-terminal domain-containing protein [Limisphaera sp.]